MRTPRKRAQITVSLLPGAEPWVLVRHQRGHFKLPGNASALELVQGALSAWGETPRAVAQAELLVRVPWSYLVELETVAGAAKSASAWSRHGQYIVSSGEVE